MLERQTMKRAKNIVSIPTTLREDVEILSELLSTEYAYKRLVDYNLIELYSLWYEYSVRNHVVLDLDELIVDSEQVDDFVDWLIA